MGIKTHVRKALVLAATLLLTSPALAQVPALEKLNYKLSYNVSWNGFNIGRIRVKVSEDTFGYQMSVDTRTGGIAKLFSNEKTMASIEGKLIDGKYVPAHYTSHNENGGSHTDITYDEAGAIATYERKPPRGKNRTEVPREDTNQATDPVTAFFRLRKLLHDAMEQNARDVDVKSYDGVRLAELTLHVVSPARVEVVDHYQDGINSVISRKPIAGYSAKELKKFNAGDPTIHIFFTADGRMLPVKAQLQTGFGTIAASLSEIKKAN